MSRGVSAADALRKLREGDARFNVLASDDLVVIGTWHSLETGKVEFLKETLPR
jgi:hypothetical protein